MSFAANVMGASAVNVIKSGALWYEKSQGPVEKMLSVSGGQIRINWFYAHDSYRTVFSTIFLSRGF